MNGKLKKIWILFVAVFFIALLSNVIFSNPSNPFETSRKCSDIWGGEFCNSTILNDANFDGCNGTQFGTNAYVSEIYINATNFFYETGINVTCEFREYSGGNNSEYLWYYNGTNWINIYNWTSEDGSPPLWNRSAIFVVNSSEGAQRIRCIISFGNETTGTCANSTYYSYTGTNRYDNDDVNFTVTSHLAYDFWNLTNYTTGANISSNQTYNRNDSSGNPTYINVSAKWNKNISFAQIEHNGTGTWTNYTISSYTGNWTNYTLNLSNTSEFNNTIIAIRAIYANDTYSATNSTSPLLYFYLSSGAPPNITSNQSFFVTTPLIIATEVNLFDGVGISVNVYDDVGISSVIANITYPNSNSTNATMTRYDYGANNTERWVFYFNTTLPLNETGYYVVRITAIDIGGQEKASGVDVGSNETASLHVINSYGLTKTSGDSPYMRGENVTIQAESTFENPVQNANWTANITKINETSTISNVQQTIFNYTILPNDTEGNYSIFANASKNGNSGNITFEFNVSKNLSLTISTSTALSPGNTLNISVNLTNARGELYNNTVNSNITCPNGMKSLSFSSGHASTLECTAPDSYSTAFNITVNVSDAYNNTGENYTTFTTTAAPSSGASGGGGGGFATETKKCSDKTLYSQCSSQWPLYCSNGTLVNKCSICGCNNTDYGCQPDGSCTLIKKDDFNFETNITSIELRQGEDKEFVVGILKNTGNTILNLRTFLDVPPDCCNISLPSTIELKEREEKEFNLSIHVPLTSNVSEYLVKIGIGTSSFRKERSFSVMITSSPYYNSLAEIEAELLSIEKEIQEYRKAGVNVDSLENKLEQAKLKLYNANSSISNDQLSVLTGYISEITGDVKYVQSGLSSIRTQIFFSQLFWLVLLLIISSLVTTYAVPEVLMPLYKIEREIRKLKDEEKILVSSRVETEKQYFMRKIDENTFSKIMIGKQDKIFKTRASIKEMEDKTRQIVETRLKPRGIANTVKEKINKVFKKKNEN